MKKVTNFFGHLFDRKTRRRKSVKDDKSRPKSTVHIRPPVSPPSMRDLPPSTSLEELVNEEKSDTPLSKFLVNRDDGVEEKSKDGSILYYRSKESVADSKRQNIVSQSRRVSRDRIRSTEEPRVVQEKQRRTRQYTPSDPGGLEGLPYYDRTSGEWNNIPKPRKDDDSPPPPLPQRKYLDDEVEVNAGVSHSDWSDDMSRPKNDLMVDRARQGIPNLSHPPNRNKDLRSPDLSSQQNSRSPSPKQRISGYRRPTNSSGSESRPRPRPPHTHREETEILGHGSDNLAYSRDGNTPKREHRNTAQGQDSSKHRPNIGEHFNRPMQGDAALDERQQRNQRHRRINDLRQDGVPLTGYDQGRLHLLPGVYLRPKPYYPQAGMAEPSKRYSDASDYSDLIERSPCFAERVNRDFDPYFFRSRWSTTPDSNSGEVLRRRNSDFVMTEDYVPSRDPAVSPRQPYRRSLIIEEHYDSDVIRDQAVQAGRSSNLSSGYQSQSSRNDESPNDFNLRTGRRYLPTPPHASKTPPGGGKYHPRLAPPPTRPSRQDMPLPDVPFLYHSPERERRYLPAQPPLDVAPERSVQMERGPVVNSPKVTRRHPKTSPQRRDIIGGGRYRSPLSSVKERLSSSTPPQEVSPERSLSPATPQRRLIEQYPDLTQSHSISTQAPEVVARGQQTDPVEEEEYDENAQPMTHSDEQKYSSTRGRHDIATDDDGTLHSRGDATDDMESTSIVSSTSDLSTSSKRPSTEYGSLIDIMYRYRQNVRESRQKENPAESPESRLRYERDKLKTKLKKELEPRHRQTRNLELVIDTLLYLCERENNTVKKRSWHRDNSNRPKSKSRPNSAILLTPTDDNPNGDRFSQVLSTHSDATKGSGDYASIQSDPIATAHVTNDEEHQIGLEDEQPKARRIHDYHEITVMIGEAPEAQMERAFPSEEELNRILAQNNAPPPIPPRRKELTGKKPIDAEDTPPPISPRKNVAGQTSPAPETKSSHVFEKNIPTLGSEPPRPPEPQPQKAIEAKMGSVGQKTKLEPPYARVNKRNKPTRRRSLPSMHLSESELKWLVESGGNVEEITKRKYKKFEDGRRGEPRFQSTRVRSSKRAPVMWSPLVKQPKQDEVEESFIFDDLPTDETADAEDIITAIEQKMSERQSPLKSPKQIKQSRPSSPFVNKANALSDSDMGTWSSSASMAEIPNPPPRRARFHRSEGHYPNSIENTPSSSPVFMNKQRFHTPPPSGENLSTPPIPIRKESLSPVKIYPVFTPPISPYKPSPLARRASSVISVPRPSSPKIVPQPAASHFTPRKHKQYRFARRFSTKPTSSSVPSSPATGPYSNTKRIPLKYAAKLPFTGKKFTDPSNPVRKVTAAESNLRRISRKGEVITLPSDDDYAIPFDCLRNNGYGHGVSRDHRFTPIQEGALSDDGPDYDYATPINAPPNLLLRQRIMSRSAENILRLRDYETAV